MKLLVIHKRYTFLKSELKNFDYLSITDSTAFIGYKIEGKTEQVEIDLNEFMIKVSK